MGQLVADLFTKYERRYHDPRVAAIATQVALENLDGVRPIRRNPKELAAVAAMARAATWEALQAAPPTARASVSA